MKKFINKSKASKHVCFIDGFSIRHGVIIGHAGGVWRVDCGGEIVCVWEEDLFTSPAAARAVLNKLVG